MNTKKIILSLLLFPAGICMAQDKFEIAGKIPGAGSDKKIILSYVNAEGKNARDSALLEKGSFRISGTTLYANKAFLVMEPVVKDTSKARKQQDYQQFYLEKGSYKVTGTDNIAHADITGTPSQTEFREFNAQFDSLLVRWRKISADAMVVYKAKDTVALQQIQAIAKPLHDRMEAVMDSFIFSRPDSYVSLDLVNENKTSVIDPVTFDPYYSALSERVLKSNTGQRLTAKYDKARAISIGQNFDFSQPDSSGAVFTLSSLKGKYVLVDFWASWCVPCRAENPNVLKAYNHYKDKNFEIVGVSVDDSKASWLKAVQKDGLPWVQVSDLKGWKNEVALKYGISAVPQNILVDPNGVIIARNLRGEDLEQKLATIFN